jgi:hypothetical protein
MKNVVYQEKIVGLHILRQCTSEVIRTGTRVMLVNTWCKIEYSFDMYQAANVAHICFVLLNSEIASSIQ